MATELYFVRHGESLDNVAGVSFDEMSVNDEGFLDNPLSELGEMQARAAAEWFDARRIKPDVLYSSGLTRSTLTAQPLAEMHNMPIQFMPELREVHIEKGTLGGLKTENKMSQTMYNIPGGKAIRDRMMEVGVGVAFNIWSKFGLPGFESRADLMGRAGYCLDTLGALPCKRVVAVAHNFFLAALLLELVERNPLNYLIAAPHIGFMPNCSVTCVIARPPKFRIRFVARPTNDFS